VLAADAHRAQRSEREALQQQHQATLKDLEVAHQSQLMDQREALKAERSLQLQQARQATRLVDDLQAERLHLKALVERSQLPTGPRQVKP
jgi:hypothetical protein